jgi:DNA-binding transcriptional MerR regulator
MGQRGHIVYNTLRKRYEVVIESIGEAVAPPKKYLSMEVISKMKFSILSILLVLSSFGFHPVFAQDTEDGDPGITPDSFLYGLDVALDKLNLLLTFDQAERSRKGLEIAKERLLEVRKMALENKVSALERAAREHDQVLARVEQFVQELEVDNTTTELVEEIEIEKKLIEHKKRVEDIKGEIKVKITVRGLAPPEVHKLVDIVLSEMENKTGEVEIVIKNKKERTKIKIKRETGRSDEEIEEEIARVERARGLAGLKMERAADRIEDANAGILEVKELLSEIGDVNAGMVLLAEAEKHLSRAEIAFSESKYGEAFGQATAAYRIAKALEKQLEKAMEEEHEAEVPEEERKIEVKVKPGRARVKVRIGEVEDKFVLRETNRREIIVAIAKRTGLTVEEIKEIIELEEEHEREPREREIKVVITDGTAEIEVSIEGREFEFSLDTKDRASIIEAISEKTGLTPAEVKELIKWKVKLGEQERRIGRPEKPVEEEHMEEEVHEEEHDEEDEDAEEHEEHVEEEHASREHAHGEIAKGRHERESG